MFIERSKGYGLKLEEFNGKFSLVQGNEKDGRFFWEKCRRQRWNKDERRMEWDDKDKPVSVFLGDRQQAEAALTAFLNALHANADGPTFNDRGPGNTRAYPGDDAPF